MDEPSKELFRKIRGSSVLALPQSATKVLELSKNPDNGPPEYEVPIAADPGMTAQILRFANSSFFGFGHKITTVRMALTLVSIRTVRNFVLWNAVFSLLPNPRMGTFLLKRFYQDALRRAVFCKVYAESFNGLDPEQLFVAGLFQDIAVPILIQSWPEDYAVILERLKRHDQRLSELEQERFGWNHAQAGALLVEEWGLDDEVSRSIAHHIRNDIGQAGEINTSARLADAVVCLSSLVPSAADDPFWYDADGFFMAFQSINSQAKNSIKGSVPTPKELFEQTDTQYQDMLKIAQLPAPDHSLTACLEEYFRSMDEDTSR